MLLIIEVALYDRSAIVLVRGIQGIFWSVEFVRFIRCSIASAPLGVVQC